MKKKHASFVLHKSWITPIEKLSDNLAGELFICILKYVNDEPQSVPESICDLYNQITDQIEFEWATFNPKTQKYHHNYKGGITPENKAIRNSAEINFWRTRVFERDQYTCQTCGEIGGKLNAHHIQHFATNPEVRTELSNGITLCEPCHKQEHKR